MMLWQFQTAISVFSLKAAASKAGYVEIHPIYQ